MELPTATGTGLKPAGRILVAGLLSLLAACDPPPAEVAGRDDAAVRAEIQALTEDLYWMHLRLDTARTELQQAEDALAEGSASSASFHVGEAMRAVEKADDKVLETGQALQQTFNLDQK